jgi:stage III sporulation protein AE
MLMTVMMFVFSARGIMSHSADTLGGRAIKFAAGSFIPIVGSNIGEILRGVGSGLSYIKSTVGVVGVIMILLITLPVFINVLFRRLVLGVAEALSDFLGMTSSSRLIHEFSSIYGMLLAVISMSAMLFIASVIICVKIGSAV